MAQENEVKEIAIPLEMLTSLYDEEQIETVHAITGAENVLLRVTLGGNVDQDGKRKMIDLQLPAGNYLIERVVSRPTAKRGLFAIQAPRTSRGQTP